MVRKRDLKLGDYNISKEKYFELKYFCMQYGEKKRKLRQNHGFQLMEDHTQCSNKNNENSLADQQSMKNAALQADIKMIEETAMEADMEVYPYILKNVTEGIAYEYMDVPLSRTKFYDPRRYFFFLLSQKR